MTRGRSRDRRGSGPLFYVMLVVVLYALFSVVVALSTAGDCGDARREWRFVPPGWECQVDPNVIR